MIRQIFFIAGQNFSGWHKNARVWMTFVLGLVLCLMLSDQMITRAQTYHSSIQLMEPFIWTFGDEQSVLFSTLLLLLLFADMPFISSGTPFYLMRIDRKTWLAGQAAYIVAATAIYLVFILAATCGILLFAAEVPQQS